MWFCEENLNLEFVYYAQAGEAMAARARPSRSVGLCRQPFNTSRGAGFSRAWRRSTGPSRMPTYVHIYFIFITIIIIIFITYNIYIYIYMYV